MKKSTEQKKYSTGRRNDLKVLTEEFLDKDWKDILPLIENNKALLKDITERIAKILLPYRYPGDEVDEVDISDDDREQFLHAIHTQLSPLWNNCKTALFDYLYGVRLNFETYSDIKTPKPKTPKGSKSNFNTIIIKANFDAGKINLIREDVDLVNNFIKFLEGTPTHIFAKCENCGKFIIVTRSDRKCCSTKCAASLIQKNKWGADPDACKEKERDRNRRRKEQKRSG